MLFYKYVLCYVIFKYVYLYRILAVSAHIAQWAANETIKFTVFPFCKMTRENDDARRTKEQYFIKKFKLSLNST